MTMHQIRQTVRRFAPFVSRVAGIATASLLAASVHAVDRVWSGAATVAYTNSANWVGGVAPVNNDYSDRAIFRETTPAPYNRTPTLYGGRTVNAVLFDGSTGWTLTGPNEFTMKAFSSTGVGTNTINCDIKVQVTATCTVGTGNTLVVKNLREPNNRLTLTGGGALLLNSQIVGNSSPAAYGIDIGNALLRIAAATPTQATSGYIKINDKQARFQLKTTVAAAKALIGPSNRIRDNVGRGLIVTDIGGGYVEITVRSVQTVVLVK